MKTAPTTILIAIEPDDAAIARIRAMGPDVEIRMAPWEQDSTHLLDGLQAMDPELMKGVDVLLCEFPPANFDDFNQLSWIQISSAGYGQILGLPVLERGIRVTNGLGNFDVPIAEWNIMMMLIWQRCLLDQLANQQACRWDRDARFQRDAYGSTIGFYGYGGIARETARLAKAMHLQVWALTRDGTTKPRPDIYCVEGTGDPQGVLPDRVFGASEIETFLGGLDYCFVTVPLTPATRGLIGETELRMLKPEAVLINPSRAQIIEEDACIRCMNEQWIRGASLDVHYAYPLPPEHPLWTMPNVILTPHVSGSTASPHFTERIYDIFEQNCRRFIADAPLLNELSRAQLSGE